MGQEVYSKYKEMHSKMNDRRSVIFKEDEEHSKVLQCLRAVLPVISIQQLSEV